MTQSYLPSLPKCTRQFLQSCHSHLEGCFCSWQIVLTRNLVFFKQLFYLIVLDSFFSTQFFTLPLHICRRSRLVEILEHQLLLHHQISFCLSSSEELRFHCLFASLINSTQRFQADRSLRLLQLQILNLRSLTCRLSKLA